MAPPKTITPEAWADAQARRDQGQSYRSIARDTGISTDSLRRRFGPSPIPAPQPKPKPGKVKRQASPPREREPDPPPQAAPSSARQGSVSDAALTARLAKWAVAPAIPAGLYFNCEYCATHFTTEGPKAARQLVELSANHPELREVLETLYNGAEKWAWVSLLAGYVAIPLAHHLTPDPIYRWVAPVVNMPPRSRNGATPHAHTPPPPPPEPGADQGIDLDSMPLPDLIALAKRYGLEVPSEVEASPEAFEPEPETPAPEYVEPVDTIPGDDAASPLPADAGIPPEPGADRAPSAEGNPPRPGETPATPPSPAPE